MFGKNVASFAHRRATSYLAQCTKRFQSTEAGAAATKTEAVANPALNFQEPIPVDLRSFINDQRKSPYVSAIFQTIETIKRVGAQVDEIDYNEYLWQIVQNGETHAAKQFYDMMIEQNQHPNLDTYGMLYATCIVDYDVKLASLYLYEMIKHDIAPTSEFYDATVFILQKYPNTSSLQAQFKELAARPLNGVSKKELTAVVDKLHKAFFSRKEL